MNEFTKTYRRPRQYSFYVNEQLIDEIIYTYSAHHAAIMGYKSIKKTHPSFALHTVFEVEDMETSLIYCVYGTTIYLHPPQIINNKLFKKEKKITHIDLVVLSG